MTRPIILLTILILSISTSSFAQNSVEDLIKAVIEKETQSYVDGDYQAWSGCWLHSPQALFTYANSDVLYSAKGWSQIKTILQDEMEAADDSEPRSVERTNFNFEISDNMAWVWFNQYDNLGGEFVEKLEARVLKKVDGEWQIMSVNVVETSSYE